MKTVSSVDKKSYMEGIYTMRKGLAVFFASLFLLTTLLTFTCVGIAFAHNTVVVAPTLVTHGINVHRGRCGELCN
jgi:hypothetical protein